MLIIMLVPGAAGAQSAQTPAACERLASRSLPNTTITLSQVVNAGAFSPPNNPATRGGGGSSALAGTLGAVPDVPGRVTANTAGLGLGYNGGRGVPPFNALPAFCRVAATLTPSPSSVIHMEIWMPLTGWNGHFRGASPNGLGGVINYNAMGVGLTEGFAVAGSDMGHEGGGTAWMQIPDKVTDFAGRAMHETTVAAKALTNAYYGTTPKYSYMIECGGGSAAALHEVQKYPADYDGVVVGGHAAHLTRQMFGQFWLWQSAHPQGAVLGSSATLDQTHLISDSDYGLPLFVEVADRFSVMVYRGQLGCAETLVKVREVIEEEKPAHTEYHLCIVEPSLRVGYQARVGIDTVVGGESLPTGLGDERGTILSGDKPAEVGVSSRVGIDTRVAS